MRQNYIERYRLDDGYEFLGAHLFSQDNANMLVSSQTGTTILLDDALTETLVQKTPSDDLKFKLVQRALAKTPNSRETVNFNEAVSPKFFMIDLTQECVMGCLYCFRHIEKGSTTISNQVLDDICDYIIDYCKKYRKEQIDIQPWGGEPFLAFDKIKRIDDRMKAANVDATISVETCGVLLSREFVRESKQRGFKIGVSVDGSPEVHNLHRPLANGGASFEKMRAGLENLHADGYLRRHTTISTVTKETLPYVEKSLDCFCDELKLHQFKFNLVKQNPTMKRTGLELTPDEAKEFAERMFDKLIETHRRGSKAIEVNVSTKILNLLRRKCGNICISRGCMGGRKLIAFDKQGRIFSCDMTDLPERAFGSIYDGRDLVETIRQAVETHPFFQKKSAPKCDVCPWKFFCRGGCASAGLYKTGDFTGEIDPMECAYNEALYPRIVELFLTDRAMLQRLVQDELSFYRTNSPVPNVAGGDATRKDGEQ